MTFRLELKMEASWGERMYNPHTSTSHVCKNIASVLFNMVASAILHFGKSLPFHATHSLTGPHDHGS